MSQTHTSVVTCWTSSAIFNSDSLLGCFGGRRAAAVPSASPLKTSGLRPDWLASPVLKCPWARHWIPVSCESAAPDLTPVLTSLHWSKKPRLPVSPFFFHHIDHPKEEFYMCSLLCIGRSVYRVSFGTAPLESGRRFIGLFKDTSSGLGKRKRTCVPWKAPFFLFKD